MNSSKCGDENANDVGSQTQQATDYYESTFNAFEM